MSKQRSNRLTNVYVIQSREETYVKIGSTRELEKRIKQLQTGNPDTIFLTACIYNVPVSFESELHNRYSAYRHIGEWFDEIILNDLLHYLSNKAIKENLECYIRDIPMFDRYDFSYDDSY